MDSTYLFLGDSITDAHHLWMPETGGLGDGYVSFLNEMLHEKHPSRSGVLPGACSGSRVCAPTGADSACQSDSPAGVNSACQSDSPADANSACQSDSPADANSACQSDSPADANSACQSDSPAGVDSAPAWLQSKRHQTPVQVLNRGIDGLTVSALLRQLQRSPVKGHPDVICLLIGINDVGVVQNTRASLEQLNFAVQFEQVLMLLQKTGARLLVAGPFLFPHPREYLLWMPTLREVETIQAHAAARSGIPFLPLQDYLNGLVSDSDYSAITIDGIHLTRTGHQKLAEYLLPHLLR